MKQNNEYLHSSIDPSIMHVVYNRVDDFENHSYTKKNEYYYKIIYIFFQSYSIDENFIERAYKRVCLTEQSEQNQGSGSGQFSFEELSSLVSNEDQKKYLNNQKAKISSKNSLQTTNYVQNIGPFYSFDKLKEFILELIRRFDYKEAYFNSVDELNDCFQKNTTISDFTKSITLKAQRLSIDDVINQNNYEYKNANAQNILRKLFTK